MYKSSKEFAKTPWYKSKDMSPTAMKLEEEYHRQMADLINNGFTTNGYIGCESEPECDHVCDILTEDPSASRHELREYGMRQREEIAQLQHRLHKAEEELSAYRTILRGLM